jgi:Leucine-rich repeat (LRR) protein
MAPVSGRRDILARLRYTFISAPYEEIDEIIAALRRKENFPELCEEFFAGCVIDRSGRLAPRGFFEDFDGHASLTYAMYEILGNAPEAFLLKHRVGRAHFSRSELTGTFRVPRGLFSLPRLESLSIVGFGITLLPPDISRCRSLRFVDLRGNRFRNFPEVLTKLNRLVVLNMAYNRLEAIPPSLGRLKRLKVLNLMGNALTSLPRGLHRFQDLRRLNISMNRFAELPAGLETLTSLTDFRAAYNAMSAEQEASWESRFPLDTPGAQGDLGLGS